MTKAEAEAALQSGTLPSLPPTTGTDPDAAVVAAALLDPGQFRILYRRYFPAIHGYVRLRLRDRALCEDVTSHIFLTALAQLNNFRGEGLFEAWLFRIAQHAVQRSYRQQHYDEQVTAPDGAQNAVAVPDSAPGPEEQVLAHERLAHLRELLATLDPAQQHLIALRYGAGLSAAEIGRLLGKSGVAVRVSLHRTLTQLRRRYSHER